MFYKFISSKILKIIYFLQLGVINFTL